LTDNLQSCKNAKYGGQNNVLLGHLNAKYALIFGNLNKKFWLKKYVGCNQ
jgi:hypothetical protein